MLVLRGNGFFLVSISFSYKFEYNFIWEELKLCVQIIMAVLMQSFGEKKLQPLLTVEKDVIKTLKFPLESESLPFPKVQQMNFIMLSKELIKVA